MPVIELKTLVKAPIERVFDLARSIDAHQESTSQSNERAIAGRTTGLINLNETVTWSAQHFGVRQTLSVRITEFDRPRHFQDVMIKGAFASMKHDHFFEKVDGETVVKDRFEFSAPLGFLGRIAERLFLTRYMKAFLEERNQVLKALAESDAWKKFVS